MVSKRSSTKTLKEESLHSRSCTKEKRFLKGRQVAWMIYDYFKVSDTDESVLDRNEVLNVELRNDNIESFHMRWDETIIAMMKLPDEGLWRICIIVSFNSQSSKSHCCRCTIEILFKKLNRETTPGFKDGDPILGADKSWEAYSSRNKQLAKARLWRYCSQGQVQGQMKKTQWRLRTMDNKRSMLSRRQVKNETRSREEARIRPSSSPQMNSLNKGKSLSKKENQPTCVAFLGGGDCPQRNVCDLQAST